MVSQGSAIRHIRLECTTSAAARQGTATRMRAAVGAAMMASLALALSTSARAATIMVNSLTDTGAPGICVLRDAITAANTKTTTNGCTAGTGNDTIRFSVRGIISINNDLPEITNTQLAINGPITIQSPLTFKLFRIASTASVKFNNLAIENCHRPIFNNGVLTVAESIVSRCGGLGGATFNRGTLIVTNSTFTGNAGDAGFGPSAIGNEAGGTLTVTNSTFTDNVDWAIENHSQASIANSTFSGNLGNNLAGAIVNNHDGSLTVINSTLSGNDSGSSAGAISNSGKLSVISSTFSSNTSGEREGPAPGDIDNFVSGFSTGSATLKNSIFAGSTETMSTTLIPNCAGTIIDASYNISDDNSCDFTAAGSQNNTDPMLDPAGLSNNGGPTQTIALLSGSPAIDAIPLADCTDQAHPPNPIITDQRLFPRPDSEEHLCDIGAYEFADTPFIRFARFSGSLTINSNTRVLNLNGGFKLGRGGSIDPSTQPVAFSVGKNALRLPVGSFVQNASGYVYQKGAGNSLLRISIQFTNTSGSYRLLVFQQGAPQFTSPAPVTLTIGNNSGSTLMNVKFD